MNINKRQYAQAIYDLAKENNKVKDYLDLSLAILDVDLNNPKLFEYLSHWEIEKNEKKNLINELFFGFEYYGNWLSIIIDSGKARYIKDFINEFIKIYNEDNDIVKGFAWTTKPIDKKIIEKFEKKISLILKKNIMLENRINKEIIGGIKIEIGDNVWDNTIKNKLTQLLREGN